MGKRGPSLQSTGRHPSDERGVALITVLLITAILVGLTTQILSSHNLVINQHQNTFEHAQALEYALGAEELVRQTLYDDAVNSGPNVDHLEEAWAQPVLPLDLDGIGVMQAYVIDLHRCFNLNNLADDAANPNFERLQRLTERLNISHNFADLIKDWVDADQSVSGLGAEDSAYQIKRPPHLAANQIMRDLSELNMLVDVNGQDIQTLSAQVCLVPDSQSKINVNTADAITLSLLDPAISVADAEAVAQQSRNYQNVTDFVSANPAFLSVQSELSVTSEYFLMRAQAQLSQSRVSLTSLFRRDSSNGQVRLLQRDFGKPFRANTDSDSDSI
jgi:general secretion pathway protein K